MRSLTSFPPFFTLCERLSWGSVCSSSPFTLEHKSVALITIFQLRANRKRKKKTFARQIDVKDNIMSLVPKLTYSYLNFSLSIWWSSHPCALQAGSLGLLDLTDCAVTQPCKGPFPTPVFLQPPFPPCCCRHETPQLLSLSRGHLKFSSFFSVPSLLHGILVGSPSHCQCFRPLLLMLYQMHKM